MIFFSLLFTLIFSQNFHTIKPSEAKRQIYVSGVVNKTLLLQLVNEARKKGCTCSNTYYPPVPPLTWNDQLETAAKEHSNDMFKNKYFSHIGADGSDVGSRIEQ